MRTYKLLIKELLGLLTEVINNTIASGNEPWQTDPVPKVHTPKQPGSPTDNSSADLLQTH
jgi:hypothetical protein